MDPDFSIGFKNLFNRFSDQISALNYQKNAQFKTRFEGLMQC